jgi:hypothetical protein
MELEKQRRDFEMADATEKELWVSTYTTQFGMG